MKLVQEYERIKKDHKQAIQIRAARVVIGPSVGRVFAPGTVKKLRPVLAEMDLTSMETITTQKQFKLWFEGRLNILARAIKRTNPNNTRIYPGYKWGHATKILCLFLNDIMVHRAYFNNKTARRLVKFLYAPIDGIVIERLNRLGIAMPFAKIKEIDAASKFYGLQDILGEAAKKAKVPRIWFDDNWGDRQ